MLLAKRAVLLCKKEATYNVDPAPTGAADGMMAFDVGIKPMAGQQAVRKKTLPYFSAAQEFPTNLYAEITFKTELIGHASPGTAPAWGVLAWAASLAEVVNTGVSVVYNPVSAGAPSATLYFFIDGLLHKLLGARGNGRVAIGAHGLPMIEWRFMGLYSEPSDAANAAPTLAAWQNPIVVNKANTPTFTINGYAAVMRSFSLDFGRKIVFRNLVNAEYVTITDGEAMAAAQIELTAVAAFNPFALARSQTPFAVALSHGAGAGKVVALSLPSCRMKRPEGYSEQDDIEEIALEFAVLANAGSDDFTITLT